MWDLFEGGAEEIDSDVMPAVLRRQFAFVLRRITREPPPQSVPGWDELEVARSKLRHLGRIKTDQWNLVGWIHYGLHCRRAWDPAAAPWPTRLPTAWIVLTYMDEWVDEAHGGAQTRLERLQWIRETACRPAEDLVDEPDAWPEGLEEDGPHIWQMWREEAVRLGPQVWAEVLDIQRCMLDHEEVLARQEETDHELLRHRIATVDMSFQTVRVVCGAGNWDPALFTHLATWLAIVDDLEDVVADRATGQWNLALAFPAAPFDAVLARCRRRMVAALPESLRPWSAWLDGLLCAFQERRQRRALS